MKTILYLILFIGLINNDTISAQEEIVSYDDVYINDDDLLYKANNDSLFTGIFEKRRRNGHLVYEEHYRNGIIVTAITYFNGKQKIVADSIVFNPQKPFIFIEEYRYNLKSQLICKYTYGDNGKLKLKEEYDNEKLIYSCEYNGRKKHGKELCYSKDGQLLTFQYINGKKVKN